jgi:hypothetical protein
MIDPNQDLSIILKAQQWEQMLQLLSEVPAPHRVTNPLMQAIQMQCLRQAQDMAKQINPAPDMSAQFARGNGELPANLTGR